MKMLKLIILTILTTFFFSCENEEQTIINKTKIDNPYTYISNNSNWELFKKDYKLDGHIYNVYKNSLSHEKVYLNTSSLKAANFDADGTYSKYERFGVTHFDCGGTPTNCKWIVNDNEISIEIDRK